MEEVSTVKMEEVEEMRGFDKLMYKIMSFLGLTSGSGFVGIGALWFLWSLVNYITVDSQSAIQQMVEENYFNQALLSLILVGIGIMIMEAKKFHKK